MKRILATLTFVVSFSLIFAQTATLRLQMPDGNISPGEDFLIELWLDELEDPSAPNGEARITSAQYFLVYSYSSITINLGPYGGYFTDLNELLLNNGIIPSSSIPTPGDLRYVFFTVAGLGISPITPIKLWSIPCTYSGGEILMAFDEGTTMFNHQGFAYDITFINIPPILNQTIWIGSIDNNWHNSENWSADTPGPWEDQTVTILNSVFNNQPVIDSDAYAGILNIESGASLTVSSEGNLTTLGLFTNEGEFIIETDSTSGLSGSYINEGSIGGTGSFIFKREFKTGDLQYGNPIGWHFISSPVDGISTEDLIDYYVNAWDESTSMWAGYYNTIDPCNPISPELEPLEAWSISYIPNWLSYGCPQTGNGLMVAFEGNMNQVHAGSLSQQATYHQYQYFAGYNLFGNPYPSGLNLNTINWHDNAIPGVAFWDALNENYSYWSIAFGDHVIPPGLGFFTEWTGEGIFSVSNVNREHNPITFQKDEIPNFLEMTATGELKTDQTYIKFDDDADPGFAKEGDFHKLFSNTEGVPQIYTIANEDKLAINVMPFISYVPLAFESETGGIFTIEATEANDIYFVHLTDLLTGETIDLLTENYTFEHDPGNDEERFELHFLSTNFENKINPNIKVWSEGKDIIFTTQFPGYASVYDLLGRKITSRMFKSEKNLINLEQSAGIYLLEIKFENSSMIKKVFIN